MNNEDIKFRVIPREELKCIWMATGLISYKLCDRHYQCEDCPFDQAMRNEAVTKNGFRESETDCEERAPANDSSIQIDATVFYHVNHCWIRVKTPEKVKIGIDPFFARFILEPKVIIMPEVGDFIERGDYFAHIIRENKILPVSFPLSGSIRLSNLNLKKKPKLITSDPLGEGWLVEVKPENLEHDLKYLLFGGKVLSWYQKEERELIALRNSMLKDAGKDLGPTMQDGGTRMGCLENLLNPEQYSQILDFFINRAEGFKKSVQKTRKKPSPPERQKYKTKIE